MLTKERFVFTESYKYARYIVLVQNMYFLFLRRVKLILTLSSQHCRKERDGKNIVISVSPSLLSKSYVCMDLIHKVYLL